MMTRQEEINRMIGIVQSISNNFSFMNAVGAITAHNYSRNKIQGVFINLHYFIPDAHLYEAYIDVLLDTTPSYYSQLFNKQLVSRLHKVNQYDTVNNKTLIDKVDANGYITIYHGHAKETLKNANSWFLDKEKAKFHGERNSLYLHKPNYYVVTGKCKLEDILAFIEDEREEEIVVLNKDVKGKKKEFFDAPIISAEEQWEMDMYYKCHR